jgi:hypothetical protein
MGDLMGLGDRFGFDAIAVIKGYHLGLGTIVKSRQMNFLAKPRSNEGYANGSAIEHGCIDGFLNHNTRQWDEINQVIAIAALFCIFLAL